FELLGEGPDARLAAEIERHRLHVVSARGARDVAAGRLRLAHVAAGQDHRRPPPREPPRRLLADARVAPRDDGDLGLHVLHDPDSLRRPKPRPPPLSSREDPVKNCEAPGSVAGDDRRPSSGTAASARDTSASAARWPGVAPMHYLLGWPIALAMQ